MEPRDRRCTPGDSWSARRRARIEQHRTEPRSTVEELGITEFNPSRRLGFRGNLGPLHRAITYDLEASGDAHIGLSLLSRGARALPSLGLEVVLCTSQGTAQTLPRHDAEERLVQPAEGRRES
jgi:hypothetical protein